MDKSYFIELTNKLYRLTFFFPSKEPLRYRVRDLGDEILAEVILILEGEIRERREAAFRMEKNIEILEILLSLSKKQKWVEDEEVDKIQNYYSLIRAEVAEFNEVLKQQLVKNNLLHERLKLTAKVEPDFEEKKIERKEEIEDEEEIDKTEGSQRKIKISTITSTLNKRQEKIIELAQKEGPLQVKDIQKSLPKITKRTLRRDLSKLTELGILKRCGKGNTTCYSM
jgi:DNA-binding HxlR family transcriptional regulator